MNVCKYASFPPRCFVVPWHTEFSPAGPGNGPKRIKMFLFIKNSQVHTDWHKTGTKWYEYCSCSQHSSGNFPTAYPEHPGTSRNNIATTFGCKLLGFHVFQPWRGNFWWRRCENEHGNPNKMNPGILKYCYRSFNFRGLAGLCDQITAPCVLVVHRVHKPDIVVHGFRQLSREDSRYNQRYGLDLCIVYFLW